MPEESALYSKKRYVLNIEQKTSIRELVHENVWDSSLSSAEMDILMTNLVISEEILYKFYPEEQDERLKKGLLTDLANLLWVIKEDTAKIRESHGLAILKCRIRILEIFLENNRKKTAT